MSEPIHAANRPCGAKPTPRHRLAAAAPYRALGPAPTQWIVVPQKLSFWLNNVDGDCVTAEEAFNKACSGIFINDAVVQTWASQHGVLDGAYLDQVLDWMLTSGFSQDGNTYNDGHKSSVDWTNAPVLQNAIYAGPVKIGVAAGQLQNVVGRVNGWVATGFHTDLNLDHCTSLCGYGTIAWLCSQLGVHVPNGVDGSQPGYAMFTWDTIGVIDVPSLLAITGEAWSRSPNTVVVGSNPPTPDPVYTPQPPSPPSPPPSPTPSLLYTEMFNNSISAGHRFTGVAKVATPKGSILAVYAPTKTSQLEANSDSVLSGVSIDWQSILTEARKLLQQFGPVVKPLVIALVNASNLPDVLKQLILADLNIVVS